MKIGNIELKGKVILAPMAGITDLSFRRICKDFGAALVTSEMVSAKAIYFGNQKTNELLATDKTEKPCAVQIFGSDPEIMGEIANRLSESDFDIIDINMGCPAPKIVRNGDGSALMQDPKLVGRIVKSVSSSASKPVTAKIRLGYSAENKNYMEVAKTVQENGAAAITVHGRTRPQMYSGLADWEAIAQVKAALDIPVIGNGDVNSPESAARRLAESNVDAVMIGREACGNPWIFKRCHHYLTTGELLPEPSAAEKINLALKHAEDLVALKGGFIAMLEMRKHLAWYVKGIKGATEARVKINKSDSFEDIKKILTELLDM